MGNHRPYLGRPWKAHFPLHACRTYRVFNQESSINYRPNNFGPPISFLPTAP